MKAGEREILQSMQSLTPSAARLYHRVREKLLLAGHNYDMPKETLALIAVLGDSVTNYNGELKQPLELEELSGAIAVTPDDEITQSEKEMMEAANANLDPEATGGAFKGHRIKWVSEFKSTPNTPIAKLEKGRPISYISTKDNRRHFGRFVRINATNKKMANVMSDEAKKAFPVPIVNIEVTDLSPPSHEPLAVQI